MSVAHDRVPLTPRQLDIFVDQHVNKDVPLYNIGGYVIIPEAVDVGAFTRAFQKEIALHDAFDLRFERSGAGVVQFLQPQRYLLATHDFSEQEDARASALQWLHAAFRRPFDLADEPLHLSGLMRIDEREYWYYSIAHHLIIDGWGYGLWVRRLIERYQVETGARTHSRPPGVRFLDCVRARVAVADSYRVAKSAGYWKAVLAQWPGVLLQPRALLPAGHASPSYRLSREWPCARKLQIQHRAQQLGVQWHHFLIAALCIYFCSVTNRRALMIGLPAHNRRGAEKEVIGTFVGVSPCLVALEEGATVASVLKTLKRVMTEAARYRETSVGEMMRIAGGLGHTPRQLFDLQFNYLRLDYQTGDSGLTTRTVYLANDRAPTPLALNVCEFGADHPIEIQLDINEAYFQPWEAGLLHGRLEYVLDQALADPQALLANFDCIPPEEQLRLRQLSGQVETPPEVELDVAARFQSMARLYPDRAAIRSIRGESPGAELSYSELDRRASELAARLARFSSNAGTLARRPVAICVARGEGLIIAILATARLRRPYVILDVTHPVERLQFIVADAQPEIVLADRTSAAIAAALGVLPVDTDDSNTASNDWSLAQMPNGDLPRTYSELRNEAACIVYASDATGCPTGVVVSQAGILNLAGSQDALFTSVLERFGVTALSIDFHEAAESLPSGRPIRGSTAQVFDSRGRLAPLGAAGELWVGGPGVAIGYLNLPEATAARFVADPTSDSGGRLYRTGDRVRWRSDGALEFLGRIDEQPGGQAERLEVEPESPRPDLAEDVRRAWQSVLRCPVVPLDENFFEFGGQSLAAMDIVAWLGERFGVDLPVSEFLQAGTVRRQAARLQRLLDQRQRTGPPVAKSQSERVPLTFMQESLWSAHRLSGGSHQYNVPGTFRIRGPLDVRALEAAIRILLARHPALASVVVEDQERAYAHLCDPARFELHVEDVSALTAIRRSELIDALAREECLCSFELDHELPVRARLLRLDGFEHVLFLTVHHIAVDALSLRILFKELAALYAAAGSMAQAGQQPHAVFASREREWVATAAGRESQTYWRTYLRDAPLDHKLPLDHPRPDKPSYRGRILRSELDSHSTARIRAQAAAAGVSLFSLLSAALALLVGEYGGERDVVLGTSVNMRTSRALYDSIGLFINTLVLRTRYAARERWLEVARRNHQDWLENLRHAQLPYQLILAAANPPRVPGLNPLSQIWLVVHSQAVDELVLPGLETRLIQYDEAAAKVDLLVTIAEQGGQFSLEWLYAEDLFDRRTMQSLFDTYCRMLRAVDNLAEVPAGSLCGLLGAQSEEIVGPIRTSREPGVSIAERISRHALETPAALALVGAEGHLTYAALASRIRRLRSLLTQLGVVAGERVAVCADRRIGGVIAIAAVQALGASYVPIDGTLPGERLSFMLSDAGVKLLLADPAVAERLPLGRVRLVLLDNVLSDDWLAEYSHDDGKPEAGSGQSTACVIYTSGSTGVPKGVEVSRANIAHYVQAMCERHDFSACRRFAVSSAFHTDLGNTTLYIGLWLGACLHLLDGALMLDGRALSHYVSECGIDVIKITPGHFAALCDGAAHSPPVPGRLLIFGGEALREELLVELREYCEARGCRLVNHYGPTEATIGCLTCEPPLQPSRTPVPLGVPLPGVRARIMLDDRPVWRGAWGELWIGGPGVAAGYLNREDLTGRQFVTVPTSNGGLERYYRTGDRVRIGPDGQILFGGRLDDQVKIRGFRIELAEVNAHVLAMPEVTAAVTLFHQHGPSRQSLITYVTPADARPAQLLERLRQNLPDYMVPEAVIPLDALPLLGSGKVDRRALEQYVEWADDLLAVAPAAVAASNVVEVEL